MLIYTYKAKDSQTGKTVQAEVEAQNEQAAAKLLMSQNLVPIEIQVKGEPRGLLASYRKRVKSKEKILFARQLATLVNAGLPLLQSLRTVSEQVDNPYFYSVINKVISDIEGGSTLHDGLAKYPKIFNTIFVNLVAAGETSGSLDKTLERIADQLEKDASVNSKIRGALIYPAIVLFVIVGVLTFLLTSVLPQIKQLYGDLGEPLPFLTAILVGIAEFIISYWWLVFGVFGLGIYVLYKYLQTEPGRRILDKVKMKMPLFGSLFMKVYMARFARTSHTLLSSGVQMLETLGIVKKAVNNVYIQQSLDRATKRVKGGKALSDSLENDPHFLKLVPQMIRIGEQSGAIDTMLEKAADYYEEEIDNEIKNISSMIEPALMIVLGVVAGIVIAAILLPVYGLVGKSLG